MPFDDELILTADRKTARQIRRFKHADEESQDVTLFYDDMGYIVDVMSDSFEMSEEVDEDFIKHYGVKGMKWGIRKDRRPSGGSGGPPPGAKLGRTGSNGRAFGIVEKKKKGKVYTKEEIDKLVEKKYNQKVGEIKVEPKKNAPKKVAPEVSNEQLKAAIERIRLEKEFAQLTAEPKTPKEKSYRQKAAEAVAQALIDGGAQGVRAAAASSTQYLLDSQLKKYLKDHKPNKQQPKKDKKDDEKDD